MISTVYITIRNRNAIRFGLPEKFIGGMASGLGWQATVKVPCANRLIGGLLNGATSWDLADRQIFFMPPGVM